MHCSRRVFLKCCAAAGLFMAGCGGDSGGQQSGRVVAVNDDGVTTWDGSRLWYGSDSFVHQDRLDEMVRQGIMALTGQGSETAAWARILPGYHKGNKISIKLNANNAGRGGNVIDPLPQLMKTVVRGIKAGGVDESDIWFIEASRGIDDRIASPVRAAYPGVSFYGAHPTAYSSACTYTSSDSGLVVSHAAPGLNSSKLPDQLGLSTFLIHMPIMKAHGMAGITLTYKNLFGLFQASAIPKFHNAFFNTASSPFVEIYGNRHVGGKTALIIGDGIYGNWENNFSDPPRWSVFGDQLWPKRIFFSTDPVAVDCVMFDFLQWQRQDLTAQAETYIIAAAEANQGTRDHWNNPNEKRYGAIDFVHLNITQA
jgi:uncharacterized protein (DUF362 family)